jgi:hypothetical protein
MCIGVTQVYRGTGVLIGNRSSTGVQDVYLGVGVQ